jgi:hypothetical protein
MEIRWFILELRKPSCRSRKKYCTFLKPVIFPNLNFGHKNTETVSASQSINTSNDSSGMVKKDTAIEMKLNPGNRKVFSALIRY